MLRANPIDGAVLLGGCDKTIPALLMAAASVNLPAVVLPGGPMLSGSFRGLALGCGTDVWRLSEEVRVGTLSEKDFLQSESSMIRSRGHCNTMGTASTMALMAEAREVEDLLDPTAMTVTGRPLVEHLADARSWDTQGISGDAGGGEHAAAQEAVAGWRSRYGPHLRRTDERNRIWNRRPPCLARGRGRGPLGLIRTGDYVILDVPKRRLEIEAGEHELAARTPPVGATEAFANPARGWESLYVYTVQQANTGADLDFLITADIADGADIRLDISNDKTVSRAIAELELRHLLGPAHAFHRYQAGDVGEDVGGGFPVHLAWLASDRSSFSTGAVYDISGGRATY